MSYSKGQFAIRFSLEQGQSIAAAFRVVGALCLVARDLIEYHHWTGACTSVVPLVAALLMLVFFPQKKGVVELSAVFRALSGIPLAMDGFARGDYGEALTGILFFGKIYEGFNGPWIRSKIYSLRSNNFMTRLALQMTKAPLKKSGIIGLVRETPMLITSIFMFTNGFGLATSVLRVLAEIVLLTARPSYAHQAKIIRFQSPAVDDFGSAQAESIA